MNSLIPVLRSFNEAKAREFYIGFLGFKVDWEHRFEDDSPLYMQVSRDACVIHLSEHHGDGCPGMTVRIETTGIENFAAQLRAKNYRHFKPGVPEPTPWGTREIIAPDPFGNKLVLYEHV